MNSVFSLVGKSPLRSSSPFRLSQYSIPASNGYLLDPSMVPQFAEAFVINSLLSITLKAMKTKSLTGQGLLHATILGVGLWTFLGAKGWSLGVAYFILGTLVTKLRMKEKEQLGIAEKRQGARGPAQVWGSAAIAMICAMLTYIFPYYANLFQIGVAVSLATKLSDTCGSEIGKAFGKNTYLITTLKSVPRGTEGAVSLEGTLGGVAGSILFSVIAYSLGFLHSIPEVLVSVGAAFLATTAESYVGATYQNEKTRPWLTNELVNLFNTFLGAALAMTAIYFFT